MTEQASEYDPMEEVADAFLARYRRGERPSLTEYTEKYPQLAEQIRELFPALVVIEALGSVGGHPAEPLTRQLTPDGRIPEQLGEYRLLREVGRGGMGVVYEAVQESLGRHVALKVLPFHRLVTPVHLERFRREAKAAARLHHSNIVPVFGVGEHDGLHYYAMQFIQGQGLDVVLEEVKRLRNDRRTTAPAPPGTDPGSSVAHGLLTGWFEPPGDATDGRAGAPSRTNAGPTRLEGASGSESNLLGSSSATLTGQADLSSQPEAQYFRSVAYVGVQVADALTYAHQQGILHRDIKPSNLLLDTRGTIWVTDFGLAKADDSDDLTHTGDLVGTLRYMAPERLRGQADARSDVYGLGMTLYEMLTLRPAFPEAHRARLLDRVAHAEPPAPRQLDRRIPRDLETIVLKAIAHEPGDRYATPEALAADLRRFLSDKPIAARRTGWPEHLWRWCRRNPSKACMTAFIGLLLLILVGGSLLAAVWLNAEKNQALVNLARAEQAETDNNTLWESYLERAEANRWNDQAGRRFQTLDALGKLAAVRPTLRVRNAAIYCLTLADLKVGKEWDGFPPQSYGIDFDPAFQRYVRGDAQGNLSVRAVADNRELQPPLPGPGCPAWVLRFSPEGRYLAATHLSARERAPLHTRVWDVPAGRQVLDDTDELCDSSWPDFSPDERRVAVAGQDGSVRIYDLAKPQPPRRLPGTLPALAMAFRPPAGRQLAVSCRGSGVVQILDVETGRVQRTLAQPEVVYGVAWHPHGRLLAAAQADGRISIWGVDLEQRLVVLEGHRAEVIHVAFNYRGDLLASSSWDGSVCLWEPLTSRTPLVRAVGGDFALRFSSDDRRLAGAINGPTLSYWEVADGRECRTLHSTVPGRGGVASADFSRDGRHLVTTGGVGVHFWDAARAAEICPPVGGRYQGAILSAAFDPDGILLTSGAAGLHR
jgi:serine/threonine protein kinase/WD40 repeat protein